ncbi:MAG: hypothetical protein U0821_22755 [Chloroflexota bacterium]
MTSTVVTLATQAAALGPDAQIGIVIVVTLIASLTQRELAAAAGPRFRELAQYFTVVIAPLVVVFLAIVATRIING